MMKKISIIAGVMLVYLSLFAQTACNSTKTENSSEGKKTQSQNGQQMNIELASNENSKDSVIIENEKDVSSSNKEIQTVPLKINTKEFKKLVFNYDSNPSQWVFEGDLPTIIDFYADWCKPCKIIAPTLEELQKEYAGKIRVYKINTDENKELSALFQIRGIPAILFIPMEGQPQMLTGALPKESFLQNIKEIMLVE